ncbi:MAG: hypothetical protein IJ693_09910 [Bacteroidaceae bacterium]|nr:hypothetical protein [Bacteroidaceae bacterium]
MEYDIALELARLHILNGADFVRQLKFLAGLSDFKPVKGETNIYSVGGENNEDYYNLLNAARKAVGLGYRVFILPNPQGIRTADFIFERKGIYKMYDLKTIQGKSSVLNRLLESVGQTNHVLLNMTTPYNARLLAAQIKTFFAVNPEAMEVLIFKGKNIISVSRRFTYNPRFIQLFRKMYE